MGSGVLSEPWATGDFLGFRWKAAALIVRMNIISLAVRRLNLEFSKPEYFGGPFDTSFPLFAHLFIQSIFMDCWLCTSPVIETGRVRVNVAAPIACLWSELSLTSTTG